MAELAGIFYFDGRQVTQDDTAIALRCLTTRNRDSVSVASGPGIVLVQYPHDGDRKRDTPRADGSVCHWDGRLDNRSDLIARLGFSRSEGANDCALALAIYSAEGWMGFRSLIGDWSLALWAPSEDSLYL